MGVLHAAEILATLEQLTSSVQQMRSCGSHVKLQFPAILRQDATLSFEMSRGVRVMHTDPL